ncbi:MAG: hypothetical protein K0S18_2022 [Anaerocolumna sp.]|jgi:TRAP-type C4-dicarboxylate transport system permease small subunit|nr:hypothetical protein [Anaerocolumna sp.]
MERKESKFSRFFDIINKLEDLILLFTLAGMFFVIILQIIGRVSNHPFPWTEETTRYLFLWMMFMALAAGFNKAESSRVTIFLNYGPKWLKKLSEILYAVFVLGFFGFMVVYGIQLVQQQIMLNEMGTALLIPMAFIGVCVPISGVLGIIGTIQSFLEYLPNIQIPDRKNEEGGN